MSLAEYQSAAKRVCFDREAAPDDLARLGSKERWLIYRRMVRARLIKVVEAALPRTHAALDEPAFLELVASWLASAAPDTRYFRAVPEGFAAHALAQLRASHDVPSWLPELLEYELRTWALKYLPDVEVTASDFDFDAVPVLDPSVELIELQHPVQKKPTPEGGYKPSPTFVCLYRSQAHEAMTWTLSPITAALMVHWKLGELSVAESVREVCEKRGRAIDQRFLDTLSGLIADFLDRGVLRGSR